QERLADLPEANDLRRAHADFFLKMAEAANWGDPSQQAALLDRLEADHINFRQAFATSEGLGRNGLEQRARLAAALADFWWLRGHLTEGRLLIDRALT